MLDFALKSRARAMISAQAMINAGIWHAVDMTIPVFERLAAVAMNVRAVPAVDIKSAICRDLAHGWLAWAVTPVRAKKTAGIQHVTPKDIARVLWVLAMMSAQVIMIVGTRRVLR
jgi:hypothetical protein